MPERKWFPGGKGGGGHFDTVYTLDDILKARADAVFNERRRAPKLSEIVVPPMPEPEVQNPSWLARFWSNDYMVPCLFGIFILVLIAAAALSGVEW